MKVYITKYVLTKGIVEKEAEDYGDGTIKVNESDWWLKYFCGEGKEWHRTRESAVKCAEKMRKKKISSLKNQIEKLEKMKFE